MFIYLSKKIAIPNNILLKYVAWNRRDGYLACGGENGLLKVLKLETSPDSKLKGLAASSNLSMNQTLEGHSGAVQVIIWNEQHHKLTTSDGQGLIIVWMLFKGSWYEEMINNRNKSVVRGMKWNADGQKICIAYEDGAVIVGSVDGNRIWGKDIKGGPLIAVEWSPDGKFLLFGIGTNELHLYDSAGNYLSKVPCHISGGVQKLISVEWYNGNSGYVDSDCPCLAICYSSGQCQIMRSESDDNPIIIDTGLEIAQGQWNHNGSLLAIAGIQQAVGQEKDINVVQFYTPFGEHLRSLKVPGQKITSLSWEGGSLRLALAVDSYIYFANIRPDYKWAYFANTVVYAYNKMERVETCVMFWNIKSNEKSIKYVKSLVSIAAHGEMCCLAMRTDSLGKYRLALCNAIGTQLDMKEIEMEPVYMCMTKTHLFVASKEAFYVWQFKNLKKVAELDGFGQNKMTGERLYHIDDVPSGAGGDANIDFVRAYAPTQDLICCMTASDRMLLVGRESGIINQYSLPTLALVQKRTLQCRPHLISLNSTATRMAIIDTAGLLTFFDFETVTGGTEGQAVKFERKDVWDMKWAEDNSDQFAMIEKTKLYIFRGLEAEEPITSSGFICQFSDLQVKSVFLDEILEQPDNPTIDNVLEVDTKALKDIRALLEKQALNEAVQFAEENPHPRLWRLLSQYALEQLNMQVAELAFVKCKDYAGVQFVKRITHIKNDVMKKAEISSYFSHFDDAEKIYLDMDRRDLAVELRERMGDWFRVVQLLKTGAAGDDKQLETAWNAIGDFYADRLKWQQAVNFYLQGNNQDRIVNCYYMLEDYLGLKRVMQGLPDNHRLLPNIGQMFASVGMSEEAVETYVKCHRVKEAVDCCVALSQWNRAIELAKQYEMREIDTLLAKYARHLLEKNKIINAIELYRKANHFLDAAKLLYKIAAEESANHSKPLRVKKLYVLAAILVERHSEQVKMTSTSKLKAKSTGATSAALAGLLQDESLTGTESSLTDNAWHGAEAYHFYMLAQKQLFKGDFDSATRTAMHLRDYEDIIKPQDAYSLIALSAAACEAFNVCSNAFIKLESLSTLTEDQRRQYEELAMEIFVKHSSRENKRVGKAECLNCDTQIPDWCTVCPQCDTKFPICIVSGRPIMATRFWVCPTCKHKAGEKEILATSRKICPLCHCRIT